MSSEIRITVPRLDFDLLQGQYLDLTMTFEVEGTADTMDGAEVLMDLRLPGSEATFDRLTIANGRIEVTGVNSFLVKFPGAVTDAYVLAAVLTKVDYRVVIVRAGITENVVDGVVAIEKRRVAA